MRFGATANFAQVQAQLAALQKQVAAFNQTMVAESRPRDGSLVDAKRWKRASAAVMEASDAYRAAAASTGALTAQQLRARPEVERHIDSLQKHKIALRDIYQANGRWKSSIREVYNEQLRLRRMTMVSRGIDKYGREISDITVPNRIPTELDGINQRLRYTRTLLHSASIQMVNLGKNTQWTGRQLTVGFTYPMALFGAATAKMAYDVDKQLTRIAKVYDSTLMGRATSVERMAEMEKLRADSYALAAKMAREYGAAATEVLDVEAQLAATGLSGRLLMGATEETVRIAALGELDFSQATDMTIALQTAFKDTIKTSEDLTDAFNMMNAVENATSLSIQDIAESTPRAASALAGLGASVEEMTVMLTAMRSAGVKAAEGANALKSVSARIINPGVLGGAQQFFDGFVNLEKLSERSGGNLFKFVQGLAEATREMDNYQRMQGFAKLFGAWQFNRGAAIVKNMSDAMLNLNDASNQTARAMKVMQMTAEERAALAEAEIAKKMNSISGQFEKAWESIKLTAAKMGESFLPIATKVINWLDKIMTTGMKVFGSMPDWAKNMAMVGAAIMALAGPIIMATGLFLNMFGWGLKIVSLGKKMPILTRAQQAAELQAKRAAAAYVDEAQAVKMLTAEITALAAAQGYSTGVGAVSLANASGAGRRAADRPIESALPPGYSHKYNAAGHLIVLGPSGKQVKAPPEVVQWKKEQAAIKKSIDDSVDAVKKAGDGIDDAADGSKKVAKSWTTTKVATGLMTASLVGSMVPYIGQFADEAMMASIALMGIGSATDMIKNAKIARAAKQTGDMANNTKMFSGFLTKVGDKLKFIVGRMGLVGMGLTALTAAGLFVWRKSQESSKRQDEMNNSADKWAEALGGVAQKYGQIEDITKKIAGNSQKTLDLAEKLGELEVMKPIIEQFEAIRKDGDGAGLPGDDSELRLRMMQEYAKMVDKTNLSERDAAQALEAVLVAAGYDLAAARIEVQKIRNMLGEEISSREYGKIWKKDFEEMFNAGGDFDNRVDGLIKEFSDSMSKFGNAIDRGNHMDALASSFEGVFGGALEAAVDEGAKKTLERLGVEGEQEIMNIAAHWKKVQQGEMSQMDFEKMFGIKRMNPQQAAEAMTIATVLDRIVDNDELEKSLAIENKIVQELAKQADVKLEVYTLEALQKKLLEEQYAVSKKQAILEFRRRIEAKKVSQMGGAFGPAGPMQQLTDAQKLYILNQMRVELGLKRTVHLSDMFKENTKGTALAERQVASEARKVNDVLRARRQVMKDFMKEGGAEAMQGVWTGITSAVASQIESDLSAAQSSAMDALEATFDREESALDRRAEYWDNFYENAIDKTNKYYDSRIESIEKILDREQRANDIRQRIFEAEQRRLQQMADAENANIDFNMALSEGRLDEAAKIMNDSNARSIQSQMENEQRKAEFELEARRISLEKQIDLLEKQRDRRLEALEDAREAKEKAIAIARERTQKENEIERKALEERQAMQSKYYEQALAELNAYIPTSQKDLENHIAELNQRYKKYGVKLEFMATDWAKFIAREQNHQMAIAANKLKSDVNWAGAGHDAAVGMLEGMSSALGFKGVGELRKWLGLSMKAGDRPTTKGNTSYGDDRRTNVVLQSNHEGGLIGRGGSGRTGFSGGQSAHSERMVNAKVGEYMVKDDAVRKYGVDFFDRLNDGQHEFGIGGPGAGPAAMMVPFLARAMYSALFGLTDAKIQKKLRRKGLPGMFGSAAAGKYGGTFFDANQLKNAGIIANVGRDMGMSQRDIVIGLMTAMQESMLRNINYGDRDSLGLFQQRPSMGWGSPSQVTDPVYAARKFFSALKGVENRNSMPLTLAAQAVQRSAFPYAYAKWEDEARAIFAAMRGATSPGAGGGFIQGSGGRHRPLRGGVLTQGLHPVNALDLGAPVGTPVYAAADGTVSASYDIPGHEPRAAHGGLGYRSYGRVIAINHGGFSTLYAHLSRRHVGKGTQVRGGALIGAVGNTGNSSGPHLHFGAPGSNPYTFLRNGGTIRYDGTNVIGHRNETMLSAPLTQKFKEGVKNFGDGGGDRFDVTIDMRGAMIRDDMDIEKAVTRAIEKAESKRGRRRVVR